MLNSKWIIITLASFTSIITIIRLQYHHLKPYIQYISQYTQSYQAQVTHPAEAKSQHAIEIEIARTFYSRSSADHFINALYIDNISTNIHIFTLDHKHYHVRFGAYDDLDDAVRDMTKFHDKYPTMSCYIVFNET